jgi:hypothetical protein
MATGRDRVWVVYGPSTDGVEYHDTFASEEYAKEYIGSQQGFHIVPLGIDEGVVGLLWPLWVLLGLVLLAALLRT